MNDVLHAALKPLEIDWITKILILVNYSARMIATGKMHICKHTDTPTYAVRQEVPRTGHNVLTFQKCPQLSINLFWPSLYRKYKYCTHELVHSHFGVKSSLSLAFRISARLLRA